MSTVSKNNPMAQSSNEFETKYVFPNIHAYSMIRFLETTCQKDGRYPEGTISSIYFDTKDWKYLSEKINSDYLKKKIRVRWYSDIGNVHASGYAFAEIKYKIGSRRTKIRVKTETSGAWLNTAYLEDASLQRLPDALRRKGVWLGENLHPVFEIRYKRRRYLDRYSGSRICVDYDISTPRVNGYMLPKINTFLLANAVFEIKGPIQELPVSLKPLILMGCRKSSFSKYQACYQKVMNVTF